MTEFKYSDLLLLVDEVRSPATYRVFDKYENALLQCFVIMKSHVPRLDDASFYDYNSLDRMVAAINHELEYDVGTMCLNIFQVSRN